MKVRELPGTDRISQKYPAFSELSLTRAAHFSLRLLTDPGLLQRINHQRSVNANLSDGIGKALTNEKRAIVQIGANDGKRDDPIRHVLAERDNARALLVEPHPIAFKYLAELYKNKPNIQLARAAISSRKGKLELFTPEVPGHELDASVWTSRSREQVEEEVRKGLGINALKDCKIKPFSIDAMTATEILDRSLMHPDDVAVLVCDTEGQDADVVGSFLDAGIQPDVIYFEHLHVATPALEEVKNRLDLLGYGLSETEKDVLAIYA